MSGNIGRPTPRPVTLELVLSEEEMVEAGSIGVRRQAENIRRGRPDAYGCSPNEGWQVHVEGALAERAVARLLDQEWTGNLGNLKASDVGLYQVRSTIYSGGKLILHDRDADDHVFILLTGVNGTYRVRGWIWGGDGKQGQWWSDPTGKNRPAYFVPQSALRPMSELPDLRRGTD